jgi:methionine-rich copper-binding protein CopC
VTASFSEALDPTSINGTTFELRDAGGALVSAAVTYDAASRVATLNPTPTLSAGAAYTATIKGGTTGVKDVAGNPLAANSTWSFTIAADTTAPTVTAFTPASGATGVATTSAVTATFSEAMNAGTINGTTFVLSSGAGQVAANVSYDTATRVATLSPSAALASGTLFTATVLGGANGVKDSAGNALAANRVWTFTTTGTDLTPPTVVLTSPTNGVTGVVGTANVTATFSETMDATTINSTTFELRDLTNNVVAAAVTYSTTTRVVTLNPTPTLTPLTTYTATLKGGGTDPRVKDTAGNALAANVTWSFTIAPDTTPPTVSSTSPANLATGVSATANVTATFNEVMDASTISETTFELRDPANNLVPAVISYNATTRVATLNPTPNLVAGTVYSASVRGGALGVKDSAGNPLAVDRVWTFTIETTSPTVTSTSPASGATGVSRTANIAATFSEVIAAATVTAGNFELRDPSGTPVAQTSLTLSTNGRTVTLNPAPTLAPLTTYTLVIKGGASGVTDLAGNPLAADVSRTFTTRQ